MSANLIIKIEAPEIVEALNKLAAAVKPQPIQNHYAAPQVQIPAPQQPAPTYAPAPQQYRPQPAPAPTAPYAPVVPMARPTAQQRPPRPANPTPAQQAAPTAPTPAGPLTAQLAAAPSNPAPVAAAPAYTQEQLARATATLADAGKYPQIQRLFQRFGIQQLTSLPKERYGEYATALRQLGVHI